MGITQFPARAAGPADRLIGFMAHLRDNGLAVGVQDSAAALRTLQAINASRPDEVRMALKAICAADAEEFGRFDDLFDAYWRNRGSQRKDHRRTNESMAHNRTLSNQRAAVADMRHEGAGAADQPDTDNEGEAAANGTGRLVGSKIRNLEKTDLRELMTDADIAEAEEIARRLATAMRHRRSRRQRTASRGRSLDMRRVIRHSIAHGGEPLQLFRRRHRDRPAHLVAMVDVSGSMTIYARVFLSFLKGLIVADPRAEAYLFHTRLVSITAALRDQDALRAVNRLSILAQGFGGGTKIGSNLASFNTHYAAGSVTGRSIVIIMSDGYDTDPPAIIGAQLARLKKRGCRIIWLNPLKGWRDYAPVAGGMAAALPHLDYFAAANTLDSLAALEPVLERLW